MVINGIFNEQQQLIYDLGVMVGQIRAFMGLEPLSDEALSYIWQLITEEEDKDGN